MNPAKLARSPQSAAWWSSPCRLAARWLTRRVLEPEVSAQVHDGRKLFDLPGGNRCGTLTVACWGGRNEAWRAVEQALYWR
jgi:hypothetical protein